VNREDTRSDIMRELHNNGLTLHLYYHEKIDAIEAVIYMDGEPISLERFESDPICEGLGRFHDQKEKDMKEYNVIQERLYGDPGMSIKEGTELELRAEVIRDEYFNPERLKREKLKNNEGYIYIYEKKIGKR